MSRLDGQITVKSQLGLGSTFTVRLRTKKSYSQSKAKQTVS